MHGTVFKVKQLKLVECFKSTDRKSSFIIYIRSINVEVAIFSIISIEILFFVKKLQIFDDKSDRLCFAIYFYKDCVRAEFFGCAKCSINLLK